MWDGVVAALPPTTGLLLPNLRGHGDSTLGWSLPSVERWAKDVIEIIAREGLSRPAIGGLSMGGYTAMAVAAMAPGAARAYAFLSTQARADDEVGRARRAEALATLQRGGWRALAEGMMGSLLREARPEFPALRERMLAMFARAGDAGLTAALLALANRPDRRADLRRVRVPCLVLSGEADTLAPPARAREIAGCLADARLVLLPEVAHMSALEAPRQVAQALAALP